MMLTSSELQIRTRSVSSCYDHSETLLGLVNASIGALDFLCRFHLLCDC
jgi:hypothetical protein